jgi:hypothetical protein
MLEELCIKYQQWLICKKELAREKISELLNQFDIIFEHNVRPPKGHSPNLNNKRKAISSTRRDPSSFEFVETSHQYGYEMCKQFHGSILTHDTSANILYSKYKSIYFGLINFKFGIFMGQNNYVTQIVRVRILSDFGPI